MKHLIRYLSVLLCVLLLSAVFSIGVNAESLAVPDYGVSMRGELRTPSGLIGTPNLSFNPKMNPIANNTNDYNISCSGSAVEWSYRLTYSFYSNDDKPLIPKGYTTDVNIKDIYFALQIYFGTTADSYWKWDYNTAKILLLYDDGTSEYLTDFNISNHNQIFDLSFSLSPKKNIEKIEFIMNYTETSYIYGATARTYCGGHFGAKFLLTANQQSEESGLLSGILGWIRNIFDSVKNGFDSVVEGFKNIGTWFAELPGKLWAVISEGLKSLFVPSEESIQEYKDKWEELLVSRFGAVYECIDFIIDFLMSFEFNGRQDFYMPEVDLSPVGIPFKFGGYSFSFSDGVIGTLTNIVRAITSTIMIFMFINGLRKKYDEVFGG